MNFTPAYLTIPSDSILALSLAFFQNLRAYLILTLAQILRSCFMLWRACVARLALITGASRGIGEAIARTLLERGMHCVVVARSEQRLKELQNAYPQSCIAYASDLLAHRAVSKLLDFLRAHSLSPQILIHALGGHSEKDAQPLTQDALIESIQLNLGVSVALNSAFLPMMKEQCDGHIIHISSDSVLDGYSPPGYVSAKASIGAYVKSTARFYARDGICIQSVIPGIISFEGSAWERKSRTHPEQFALRKAHLARGEFGTPREVAEFVAHLCEYKNMLATGAEFLLNGGGYIRAGDGLTNPQKLKSQ